MGLLYLYQFTPLLDLRIPHSVWFVFRRRKLLPSNYSSLFNIRIYCVFCEERSGHLHIMYMRFEIESFNTEHLQDVKETCQYDSSILLQLQQRREYFLSV